MTGPAPSVPASPLPAIPGGFNPLTGVGALTLGVELLRGLGVAARHPQTTAKAAAGLAAELLRIARGRSELRAPAKDRRWADPSWTSNRLYASWLQSYLALGKASSEWLKAQRDLDDAQRARLEFVFQFLADALAPSNFPWQPEAVRRFRQSRGESARAGWRNLMRDLRENGGLPAQVDKAPFKVGGNLALSEGAVVFRDDMLELIQYKPRTPQVRAVPLLLVPPQINKFYVLDLTPDKSIVRGLLDAGLQVFVVSWRNPTPEHRNWGLSEYTAAVDRAMREACAVARSERVNVAGACAGGITLAACLAARQGAADRANTLTLLVNMLDVSAMGSSVLGAFATRGAIESARRQSSRRGVLEGRELARAFSWLRPNELVWSYWVNNVLLGQSPPAFDILYWNNDVTRLPARLHSEFLDIYDVNLLAMRGSLRIGGSRADLRRIRCDAYVVAGTTDHITPWPSCYRSTQLLGGRSDFVLSNSGHIQSLLNPPGNKKAEFWCGGRLDPDPDAWRASAQHRPGSWWGHWHEWLGERSGPLREAPPMLGREGHPALGPAPGTYVHG